MANRKPQNLGEQFLQEIWKDRLSGVPEINWGKEITHQQVQYLVNRYPYLRMINSNPQFTEEQTVKLVTVASGWVIQDAGDAMSTSPGELLYGDYRDPRPEEEGGDGSGGEGGAPMGGKGTLINQAVMTADAMVALAMEKGWAGIILVDGTPLMQWAAWVTASNYDFPLSGYTPSKADYAKRKRLEKIYGPLGEEETTAQKRAPRLR